MNGVQKWIPQGFRAGAHGLVPSASLTWEQYEQVASAITTFSNFSAESLPYYVGDFILAGEDKFPDRYTQVLDFTHYTVETLRNYTWICRKVPFENRGIMSIPHTAVVAPLPPEEQQVLLKRAKREGLTVSELRRLRAGQEDYKRRALPEDGANKQDRLNNAFERVWPTKEARWMAARTAKEQSRMVWRDAVEFVLRAK